MKATIPLNWMNFSLKEDNRLWITLFGDSKLETPNWSSNFGLKIRLSSDMVESKSSLKLNDFCLIWRCRTTDDLVDSMNLTSWQCQFEFRKILDSQMTLSIWSLSWLGSIGWSYWDVWNTQTGGQHTQAYWSIEIHPHWKLFWIEINWFHQFDRISFDIAISYSLRSPWLLLKVSHLANWTFGIERWQHLMNKICRISMSSFWRWFHRMISLISIWLTSSGQNRKRFT